MRFFSRLMAHTFLLMVSAVLLQGSLGAASKLPPEVERRLQELKLNYEGFLLKNANFPYEAAVKALNAMVLPALDREATNAAKRRDLEALVRIKADVERVKAGMLLTDAAEPPPPALKNLYATYGLELGKIEATRKAKTADAAQRYDQGLKLVQDEMTMAKEVEAALIVKGLRDSIQHEGITERTKGIGLGKGVGFKPAGVLGNGLADRDSAIIVDLAGGIRLGFVLIQSGSFTMGSPESEKAPLSNENQVMVTLSQSFWLAKTEVTQAQWEAVMGSNPSHFKGPNLPVESVSWEDAQAFITKLNHMQTLPKGWEAALPTEAQWEYACRAGEKEPYSGGSMDEVGWYQSSSGHRTNEVGLKKANAWGLHDMHGNVWEWCADWYDATLKGATDPVGPSSGVDRVRRGGSWFNYASYCRAATRLWLPPSGRSHDLGFRPALVPSR